MPPLTPPQPLRAALEAAAGRALFAWEGEPSSGLATALAMVRYRLDVASAPESGAREVMSFVGPEGGFQEDEAAAAAAAGAVPANLGPRVLRAETAAVALCAATLCAFGELAPPPPSPAPAID